MSGESSLHKLIIRTRSGEVIPGFAKQERLKNKVKITNVKGKEQVFNLKDLKAVFFVKDFRGDPKYEEVKFLNKQKVSSMVWVRVEFFDDEVLEGKIENNLDLLESPGFYLWPSDQDTNNKSVYVVKSSLKNFTILNPA